MQPLTEVAESPEAQDQEQDDVWAEQPGNAVGAEEADAENGADEEVSEWDIGPEPAGLESDFRFDLKDMEIQQALGKLLDVASPIFGALLCPIWCFVVPGYDSIG